MLFYRARHESSLFTFVYYYLGSSETKMPQLAFLEGETSVYSS